MSPNNKIANLKARKETPTQVFSCEYCKIFKNTFFAEHLRWLCNSTKTFANFAHRRCHMRRKNSTEIFSIYWNVLLWIFLINSFRRAEAIYMGKFRSGNTKQGFGLAWENFVPAVQKRDSVLAGWNLLQVIAGCNLWRVYNTAGIPAKRDRISSRSTGIM